MNYRMIARLIAVTLLIVAAFMLPPLAIALAQGDAPSVKGFLAAMTLMAAVSLIALPFRPRKAALHAREGYVVVALVWVLVSVLGALPFLISGCVPRFIDCLFETVSGFTTTGASVLANVEVLPDSMLYWRSFTHWLGGMGVLVFLLAVMSFASGSGDALFIMRAESPGPQVSKLAPRTKQTARILYAIYIGMTAVELVMLLLGGMPVLEALATAFGTAGTGGFAVKNDSLVSASPYIQWVVTVFMALFGVNFGVYYLLLLRSFRRAACDEELRLYVIILLAATLIVTFSVLPFSAGGLPEALRHAAFQVVSVMTTTGFATADFNLWPQICRTLLLVLMVVGACASSTGGGVKCSRVLILFRSLRVETQRMLHPGLVRPVKMDGKPVPASTVRDVYAYFGLYSLIAVLSLLLLSLDGRSLETNLSAVMACLNNIGPGLDAVGPMGNYAAFSDAAKLLLSVDMLIGRLEIIPVLMLLTPGVWSRARRSK